MQSRRRASAGQQHQMRNSCAVEKREEDTQRRLALAQSMWGSINAEQRQQLLAVPLQELQQRAADLPKLMPHSCPGAASCGWLDTPAQLQQAVERLHANGNTQRWRVEQHEFASFRDFHQAVWGPQLQAQLEALFTQERAKVTPGSSSSSSSVQSEGYSSTDAVLSRSGPGSNSCSMPIHHQGSAADVGGSSAMPNSNSSNGDVAGDAVALYDRLAALLQSSEVQLQRQPMNPALGVQDQTAFAQRMCSLFDSIDERICVLANKRSEHRANHGPGSSWMTGSNRGYTSRERAELLEIVKYVQEQLLTEHLWLRQALLEPAAEYVRQQLPEDVWKSGSKQLALLRLELLPGDALLDVAVHLRWQVAGLCTTDTTAAAGDGGQAAVGPARACSPPRSSCNNAPADDKEPDPLNDLLCLTADGSCMTLSQERMQAMAGPQEDSRPCQFLDWVYTHSATTSSYVSDCASKLCSMCTFASLMDCVLCCIHDQQDLSQHLEDLQQLQQALQRIQQQWSAVEAHLNVPGFSLEAAPLELIRALMQRQVVLDHALLQQSRQQLSDVQGEAAMLEQHLETALKLAQQRHCKQAAVLQQRMQQKKAAEANLLELVEQRCKFEAADKCLLEGVQSAIQQGQLHPQHRQGQAAAAVHDTGSSSRSRSRSISIVQQPVTAAHSQPQAPEVFHVDGQVLIKSLRQHFAQGTIDYLSREGRREVQGWLSWVGAYLLQKQLQYEGGRIALHALWQLVYVQGADDHSDTITAVLLLPLIQQRLDAAAAAFEAERFQKVEQELLASWQDVGGTAAATSMQDQQSKKRRNKGKQKRASQQPVGAGSDAAASPQARSCEALGINSLAAAAAGSAAATTPHSATVTGDTAGISSSGGHVALQPVTAGAADGSSSHPERRGGRLDEQKEEQAVQQAHCSLDCNLAAYRPAGATVLSSSSNSTVVEPPQPVWYSTPGSSSSSGASNSLPGAAQPPNRLAGIKHTPMAADPAAAAAAAAPLPGGLPLYGQPYRPLHLETARSAAWQGSSSSCSSSLHMPSASQLRSAGQQQQHPPVQAPCTELAVVGRKAELRHAAAPAAAPAEASENDGLLCVICQEAPRTHALLHGGSAHQCLCGACSVLYEGGSKDCPICRQQVQAVVRLYNV